MHCPCGLARGMVVDLWSPSRECGRNKTKENGKRKGEVRKCIPTYIGESPTYPAACSCCSRRGCSYFQY